MVKKIKINHKFVYIYRIIDRHLVDLYFSVRSHSMKRFASINGRLVFEKVES